MVDILNKKKNKKNSITLEEAKIEKIVQENTRKKSYTTYNL